jgi:hypothetical protein
MKQTDYDVQLAVARRYVHEYRDTKGSAAAFDLAGAVLAYRASTPFNCDLQLEEAFRCLRSGGAEPAEIIARVVAFLLFIDARPSYFKIQRAEDVALGRLILHSIPLALPRYSALVYAPAGARAREHLGVFADALLRKVKEDAARVAQRRQESAVIE